MGMKSKRQGELAEQLFEAALNCYRAESMLHWYKNFPEFVPWKHLPGKKIMGFFKAKSGPDYSILVRGFGPALVECKLFSALRVKTYGLSLHQYEAMYDAYELGFFSGYIILWQNKLGEQWTFHPIQDIAYTLNEKDNSYKLTFNKKEGLLLADFNGGIPEIAPIFGFKNELVRGWCYD